MLVFGDDTDDHFGSKYALGSRAGSVLQFDHSADVEETDDYSLNLSHVCAT